MDTGLTTVFTPGSACLSTYVLDTWLTFGIDGDSAGTSMYYLVGDFRMRSSIIFGGRTFPCTPRGELVLGIPYFSPGLHCPLGWATQPPEAGDGTTTTVYCCPSTLTLDANAAGVLSCIATMESDTLWYQSETEEATAYAEICLPQNVDTSALIFRALISATPIMLVWDSSDLASSATPTAGGSPIRISSTISSPPRPTTATNGTVTIGDSHSSLSSGAVAAIFTSAALSVILLVAGCLFLRASRRRSSDKSPRPGEIAGNNSGSPKAGGGAKAEMEDPVSARQLSKQSGAYRGKPELESQVDRTCDSNHEGTRAVLPPGTQDDIGTDKVPGDMDSSEMCHAHLAELE